MVRDLLGSCAVRPAGAQYPAGQGERQCGGQFFSVGRLAWCVCWSLRRQWTPAPRSVDTWRWLPCLSRWAVPYGEPAAVGGQ
jgi:hypothetical protein